MSQIPATISVMRYVYRLCIHQSLGNYALPGRTSAFPSNMRVIDTLSHAPRDSSPPIGFWDKVRGRDPIGLPAVADSSLLKLRLIFHWRVDITFENEVHLHMKGQSPLIVRLYTALNCFKGPATLTSFPGQALVSRFAGEETPVYRSGSRMNRAN